MDSTELIQKFLQDRLGTAPESIVPGARLVDLGLDSLMLAELMFEAEDRFAISIPSDLQLPNTVGDMTALIDTLLASKASAS
ncbi:MAG: phosphopantetheine-binding protein [Burkholderiales bacterium RIFCSPLOWO2_12_67_14]|nr:MAG: phosphopantetheine-binding protein [Burkholderiales bacterium RIFCSPLOWO2_02_FULL_67_64]OGB41118.1 MAG: phosphopantetheine-binding protein [Burkholderiales bacterium RIFCSPLOWO2_12_67_14]OGB49911.1 MAG: phosphopantetheine-binding protein [Burkholderiales bacterium RIFCSPHIGHO2_12_FULL_67_38]OGB86781.1 MAG: phosphopantetheine-binding protein [Burkholderiales bacterium RIFCSPLOWO2_12_FULL_67_210]